GKKIIQLPKGVKVTVQGTLASVEGPKGKINCPVPSQISFDIQAETIQINRANEDAQTKAYHGLVRALVQNAITGVTIGFKKDLDIVGVGYKAALEGKKLRLDLGYSHPIFYEIPKGIEVAVDKLTHVTVSGSDRQLVGQVAADIRKYRKPEPYKGKGVMYTGEVIRRKAGKTGK
ncbi:MAG: 50S ribosomal protein L6, partial [Holophagaceae bacterium]